jgi:hypothetical protein
MSLPLQRAPKTAADETRRHALEAEVLRREAELDALKVELQKLQARYLGEIGSLYRELSELEDQIFEAEVRAGLRSPPDEEGPDNRPAGEAEARDDGGFHCSNRSQASDELKRVFRDVAKSIHPDLAVDGPEWNRRHSLMAEANRAYAERDADRLRLILHAWQNDPNSIADDEPNATPRRIAMLEQQLVVIDAEFAELRKSAIYRLKTKIESTRAEGWDLFAEMRLQVKNEVARATATMAKLRLQMRVVGDGLWSI